MLHDAGKLVLAAALPEVFGKIIKKAQKEDRVLWEVEREILQTSHAEVGAYLMGVWGLPDAVVAALAFHHQPVKSQVYETGPLLFTHVSDALLRALDTGADDVGENRLLDRAYLEKLNVMKTLPEWRDICVEIVTRNGEGYE
jgi:HD-like signal output (HDOD) protein